MADLVCRNRRAVRLLHVLHLFLAFGFRVSGFGFGVSGFGFWVWGFGLGFGV
jgi:hypothetical protein